MRRGPLRQRSEPAPRNEMSIPNHVDPRDEKYLLLCEANRQGWSEEKITTWFKVPAKDLYKELKDEGYPICEVCGVHPVKGEHCPKPTRQPEKHTRGKRTLAGEPEPLPPIADAIDLFELALLTLRGDIEYIRYHKEALQDNYFVATGMMQGEEGLHPSVRGVGFYPNDAVVRLIGTYLLCSNLSVESLLAKLHRKSCEPDREAIRRYLIGVTPTERRVDALRPIARTLAKLLRGGTTKRGPKESLDLFEHMIADAWRRGLEEGIPEEDMQQELLEAELLSEEDIRRLGRIFPSEGA